MVGRRKKRGGGGGANRILELWVEFTTAERKT